MERLENEKKQIHAEYEQERIAYQKLLKDFNRMELQCENLQVGQMFSIKGLDLRHRCRYVKVVVMS